MALSRREALAASAVALTGCTAPVTRSRLADSRDRHEITGSARLGLVGDLMFARRVDDHHDDRPPASVWGTMLDRLQSLDGTIGNLECVLSERGQPWPEKAYHFRAAAEWVLPALSTAGVSAVTLANNHALDFGPVSLCDTVDTLDAGGIAHAGAGPDRQAALDPAVVDIAGLRVALIGLTDRFEPFAAGSDSPGTACLDLSVADSRTRRAVFDALETADGADADLVIASLHWAPNYEPKTDAQREFARWLIEQGVDVVHGHSAHEVRGIEVHRGRPIVYDCGDFLNDYGEHSPESDRSFLYELVVDDGLAALRLHPSRIEDETVHRADGLARRWLEDRLRARSSPFDTSIEAADGVAALEITLGA